jgi:transposase
MKIVALDLGLQKSVACIYETETGQHRLTTVKSTPAALTTVFQQHAPQRVVIEIGPLAGWVADVIRALGLELQVAKTNEAAWRWKNVKRKTDRDDALKLAQLSALNQIKPVHVPELKVRQWRSLIAGRQNLVGQQTSVKNRIRALLCAQGPALLPAGNKAWRQAARQALQALARPLMECAAEDLWRGELAMQLQLLAFLEEQVARITAQLDEMAEKDTRVQLVQTIPGVGPRLAETVVAILDKPERFTSGKQVGSYAGLTPRQYQSGGTDRQGRISKHGHRLLRALLVEVSWAALRWNEWARDTYQRVCRGSKTRKKIAIVAVARKLLVICWAMLRGGQPWQGRQRPATSAA